MGPQKKSYFSSLSSQNFFRGWQKQSIIYRFLWGQWYSSYMQYVTRYFSWFHWRPSSRESLGPFSSIFEPHAVNTMTDLFLPPPSHWNTMLLSSAPSVACTDWSYLNLSFWSQLSRLPRAWKLYSGITCQLIIISLHTKPCENREETYLPLFYFFVAYSLLLAAIIQR